VLHRKPWLKWPAVDPCALTTREGREAQLGPQPLPPLVCHQKGQSACKPLLSLDSSAHSPAFKDGEKGWRRGSSGGTTAVRKAAALAFTLALGFRSCWLFLSTVWVMWAVNQESRIWVQICLAPKLCSEPLSY
jgi:hypothetical protein